MFYVGNYEDSTNNWQKTEDFNYLWEDDCSVSLSDFNYCGNEIISTFGVPVNESQLIYQSDINIDSNDQTEDAYNNVVGLPPQFSDNAIINADLDIQEEVYEENKLIFTYKSVDSEETDFQCEDVHNDILMPLFIYPEPTVYNSKDIVSNFSLRKCIELAYQDTGKDYMYSANFFHVNKLLKRFVSPVQRYFVVSMFDDDIDIFLSLHDGADVIKTALIQDELFVAASDDFEGQNPPKCILEKMYENRTYGDLWCYDYYFYLVQIRKFCLFTLYENWIEYPVLLQPTNEFIIDTYTARMDRKGIPHIDEERQILFNNSNPYSVSIDSKPSIQYRLVSYHYHGLKYPSVYKKMDQESEASIENSEEMEFFFIEECQIIGLQKKESKHFDNDERNHIGELEIEKRESIYLHRKRQRKGELEIEKRESIYLHRKRRRKVVQVVEKLFGSTKKTCFSLLDAKPSNRKINYYERPVEDWDDVIELFISELDKRKRGYMLSVFDFYPTKDSRMACYMFSYTEFPKANMKKQFCNLLKLSVWNSAFKCTDAEICIELNDIEQFH